MVTNAGLMVTNGDLMVINGDIPSGKRVHNYGHSHFFYGKINCFYGSLSHLQQQTVQLPEASPTFGVYDFESSGHLDVDVGSGQLQTRESSWLGP